MLQCVQIVQTKGERFVKLSQLRALTHSNFADPLSANRPRVDQALRAEGYDPSAVYQEMEMDSPWVDTHDDASDVKDRVQLHSHTFYELLFCRGGSLQYLLGTQRYRLQRGDIVYIPPGTSHRPLLLDKLVEPYTRYVLWASPAFAEMLHGAFPQEELLPAEAFLLRTAATPWQEELGGLFRTGVQENYTRAPGWEAAVLGNTIRLLVQMARARTGSNIPDPQAEQQDLLDQMLVFIEGHLAEKITLADTARRFLVSESTVNQLFRRRMKVSFYRFVTQRRLIAAKVRLQEGDSAEQAAARTGFGDYSTFYRAFRREYGISPAEYRRLQLSAGAPALQKRENGVD